MTKRDNRNTMFSALWRMNYEQSLHRRMPNCRVYSIPLRYWKRENSNFSSFL